MNNKNTTEESLPWVVPFSILAIIGIFILPLTWHNQNGIPGIPAAAAITGAISAFFWTVSAYVTDSEARRLNATAGSFSGASIMIGAGALPNMPDRWPTIACVSGFLLLVITITMLSRRKSEKNTDTTASPSSQPDTIEMDTAAKVAEKEPR